MVVYALLSSELDGIRVCGDTHICLLHSQTALAMSYDWYVPVPKDPLQTLHQQATAGS